MKALTSTAEKKELRRVSALVVSFFEKLVEDRVHPNGSLKGLIAVPDWQIERCIVFLNTESGVVKRSQYRLYSPWRKVNTFKPCFEGLRDEMLSWLRNESTWIEDAELFISECQLGLGNPGSNKIREWLEHEREQEVK